MTQFKVCIVVSSIGRVRELERLLDSIVLQTSSAYVVGVCDQSVDGSVSQLLASYSSRIKCFVTESGRGLSVGRNTVIQAAPVDVTHFAFPNDTSRLAPDFVEAVGTFCESDIVSVSYCHDGRTRYDFAAGRSILDRRNVWNIIEPGMILSRAVLDRAGGFREDLGTGSPGFWQSGEGTDLLLRAMQDRTYIVDWVPGIAVMGVGEGFGLSTKARRRKLRNYGRGYARVLIDHRYPAHRLALAILAPVGRTFLGSRVSVLDAISMTIGRFEGTVVRLLEKVLSTRLDRRA